MAIFGRRTLQERIDEAASICTREQLASIVARLNKPSQMAIDAEWELIWLVALHRVGRVRHEPQFSGGKKFPDIHFAGKETEFIAEVATVSDLGYEEENPIQEVRKEMSRLYKKHSPGGGFTLLVGSVLSGEYGDRRVLLAVPGRSEITARLKEFVPFLRSVAQAPEKAAKHDLIVEQRGRISLQYDPRRRPNNSDSGHLSFDVAYSLSRNPIANVLKSKKQQLAGSGFRGLRGVILCDGDCATLTRRVHSGDAYNLEQIVREFLRQHTSIAFVFSLGLKSDFRGLGGEMERKLEPHLYFQRSIDIQTASAIKTTLWEAISLFPKPHRTAAQARAHLERGSPPELRRSDFFCYCQYKMGGPMDTFEFKLSARTLAGLLVGEVDVEHFRKQVSISGSQGKPSAEPLLVAVKSGRKLESIELAAMPGEDDDLVVLRFGPPDPAASKFRVTH